MSKAASAKPLVSLLAFGAGPVSLAAGGETLTETPPTRLVIAPLGRHDARERGAVVVSEATLTGLNARQAAAKLGSRIALDLEHCTVPGTPAYAADAEPRKVAAWGTLEPVAGVGLVLSDLEWTPLGLQVWAARAYQDLSPAVFRDAAGVVLAVHSVALCRHGELDGLTISAAAAGAQAAVLAALSASVSLSLSCFSVPESYPMKPSPALLLLLSALGVTLSPEASETDVETALEAAAAKVDALPKAEAMSAVLQRVQAIEDGELEREKKALVAQATAAGKVVPLSAEALRLTPLAVLSDLVTSLPVTVPMGRTPQGAAPVAAQPEAFTAEQEAIFAKFGLTAQEVKAALPVAV